MKTGDRLPPRPGDIPTDHYENIFREPVCSLVSLLVSDDTTIRWIRYSRAEI